MLKNDIDAIQPVITELINISIRTSNFPNKWKTAIVRPLLKKKGLDLIHENYRPVSNLSFLSKVLECVILDQINEHCSKHCLLPTYQSAYRKNFSCETALVRVFDDILWNMERGEILMMVCIELSAAFDTVDHDVLYSVLSNQFGMQDSALAWIWSYLQPRGFKVNCNGT
jgi:hypothetical protein